MIKLKLGVVPNDKPVKLTIEIPAATHRDLIAYAEAIGRQTGQPPIEASRLVVPMLMRFMATDRGFARAKKDITYD